MEMQVIITEKDGREHIFLTFAKNEHEAILLVNEHEGDIGLAYVAGYAQMVGTPGFTEKDDGGNDVIVMVKQIN